MSRRAKPFRSRWANPTAGLSAISRAQKLDADHINTLSLAYWGALNDIKRGAGDERDVDTMASAVNVSLILAETTGGNAPAIALIQQAQDALMRAKVRIDRFGKPGLDGPGALAIGRALTLHDDQLREHTAGQLQDALTEAMRRMRAGVVLEVQMTMQGRAA